MGTLSLDSACSRIMPCRRTPKGSRQEGGGFYQQTCFCFDTATAATLTAAVVLTASARCIHNKHISHHACFDASVAWLHACPRPPLTHVLFFTCLCEHGTINRTAPMGAIVGGVVGGVLAVGGLVLVALFKTGRIGTDRCGKSHSPGS